MILHEIFRVVSRFPRYISCYIAENQFSLGQCTAHLHKFPKLKDIFKTKNDFFSFTDAIIFLRGHTVVACQICNIKTNEKRKLIFVPNCDSF